MNDMRINVGSKNQTKVDAVKAVFPNANIQTHPAQSNVSEQPLTEEETRTGAINRARHSVHRIPKTYGIGLEGGVTIIDKALYLCSWGAMVTPDGDIHTAGGAKILLPSEFISPLQNGIELSLLIDNYTNKKDVRSNEGSVGIFTSGLVTRSELFSHVVTLLKGQWNYARHYGTIH